MTLIYSLEQECKRGEELSKPWYSFKDKKYEKIKEQNNQLAKEIEELKRYKGLCQRLNNQDNNPVTNQMFRQTIDGIVSKCNTIFFLPYETRAGTKVKYIVGFNDAAKDQNERMIFSNEDDLESAIRSKNNVYQLMNIEKGGILIGSIYVATSLAALGVIFYSLIKPEQFSNVSSIAKTFSFVWSPIMVWCCFDGFKTALKSLSNLSYLNKFFDAERAFRKQDEYVIEEAKKRGFAYSKDACLNKSVNGLEIDEQPSHWLFSAAQNFLEWQKNVKGPAKPDDNSVSAYKRLVDSYLGGLSLAK